MMQKYREMQKKRAGGDDRGFTLIELLVVVVIIGVLVGIAIPVYLNYRKGAQNKSAMADARNAVTAIEQCYTEGGNAYPTGTVTIDNKTGTVPSGSLSCGTAPGPVGTATVSVSQGNTLVYTEKTSATAATTYEVAVTNVDTKRTFTYKSADGSLK